MTKTKKKLLILFGVISIIIIGLVSAYFIYGSTLIDGKSKESFIKSLTQDKNNPAEVYIFEKYRDNLFVLCKNPAEEEAPYSFYQYIKADWYKNKYRKKGGYKGKEFEEIQDLGYISFSENDDTHFVCCICICTGNERRCTLYEHGPMLNTIRKLDEFDLPQNRQYYCIFKEYELLSPYHEIEAADTDRDYVREYDENYLDTDKEWFRRILEDSGEKVQKELKEEYRKVFNEEYPF